MKTKTRAVDNAWNENSKWVFYNQAIAVYFEQWQEWESNSLRSTILRCISANKRQNLIFNVCSAKLRFVATATSRKRYLLCFHSYRSGFPWLQSLGCRVLQWIIPRAQGDRTTVDQVNEFISTSVHLRPVLTKHWDNIREECHGKCMGWQRYTADMFSFDIYIF